VRGETADGRAGSEDVTTVQRRNSATGEATGAGVGTDRDDASRQRRVGGGPLRVRHA
jgi:hypothetical protein